MEIQTRKFSFQRLLNEGYSVQITKGDFLAQGKGKKFQSIYVDESSASLNEISSEDLSSSMLEEVKKLL